jgi:hypothetical protein
VDVVISSTSIQIVQGKYVVTSHLSYITNVRIQVLDTSILRDTTLMMMMMTRMRMKMMRPVVVTLLLAPPA